jgi:hypothetical protein
MAKIDLFAPMSAEDYAAILERLDLNNADAAGVLNRTARMSRAYAAGEYSVPSELAALLRLLDRHVAREELDRFRGPRRPTSDKK